MRLVARLFGGLEMSVGGERLAADYDLGPLLVAWLMLHPDRRMSRDEVAELFWPERKPGVGRRLLREVLYRLRRALREDERPVPLIDVDRDSLCLPRSAQWSSDVTTFDQHIEAVARHAHRQVQTCLSCIEKLEAALALWTGDLLHAVRVPPGELEEGVVLCRRQRRSLAISALQTLAARALDAEAWADTRVVADRMEAIDPRNEAAIRLRMQALSAEGHKADALGIYEAHAERLESLGLAAPEDETEELYQRIRHDEIARHRGKAAPLGRLPAPASPLVGRTIELGRIDELIASVDSRLVTITGMGGSGKTRLSIEAARRNAGGFRQGAWFVAASETKTSEELVLAIATALGFTLAGPRPPLDQLADWLRARESLLVLDNLEQNDGAASTVHHLLTEAPRLRVLATSRVRLMLRGEHLVPLGGLGTEEARALWVGCAHQVKPDLVVDPAKVEAICARVGGLPLAIELTAARAHDEEVDTILEGVERAVDLQGGYADTAPQHRDMRALLASSTARLTADDLRALAALPIFRGPFEKVAAAAVCGVDEPQLERLATHSLLTVSEEGELSQNPIVASFARELPLDRDPLEVLHRRWFLGRLELRVAVATRVTQREDLRAAWRSAVEAGDLSLLASSAYALHDLLRALGWLYDGHAWFESAYRAAERLEPGGPAARRCLAALGRYSYNVGRPEEAEAMLRRAADIAEQAGDEHDVAVTVDWLGFVIRNHGRPSVALPVLERAARLYERVGDAQRANGARYAYATALYETGSLREARELLVKVVDASTSFGDPIKTAEVLGVLGLCEVLLGDERTGLARLYEAAREHRRHDHNRLYDSLNALACGCLLCGRFAEAARHADAAREGYEAGGFRAGVASTAAWSAIAHVARASGDAPSAVAEAIDASFAAGSQRALFEAATALAWHLTDTDPSFAAKLVATVERAEEHIAELCALVAPLRARSTDTAPLDAAELRELLLRWRSAAA
jgi:predicted ATPase/DNA-binding SARP family transcriptional activator